MPIDLRQKIITNNQAMTAHEANSVRKNLIS